jgi:hypothetical protein
MERRGPLCEYTTRTTVARLTRSRPPKIRGIRILENPFPDIVPRITASEKRAQAEARAEARKEAEKREKRAKAKKWVVVSPDIFN